VIVVRAMERTPNLEEIFPIRDASSAALMAIKADCLYRAGIITERECMSSEHFGPRAGNLREYLAHLV
jgi:hypothetical protein